MPSSRCSSSRLAELCVTEFQIEGPSVYCRPMGVSSDFPDDFVVYQAVIVVPGDMLRSWS